MKLIPYNYRSDLTFVETFYKSGTSNSLVIDKIPDIAIDFEFVYRAEDNRMFTAGRRGGEYFNCKALDESSVEVFIPLSRKPLGIGELRHELRLYTPNNDFPDSVQHTRIPASTGLFLHRGASVPMDQTLASSAIVAAILAGQSAYEIAKEKYGYTGTEEEYIKAPIFAVDSLKKLDEINSQVEQGKNDIITLRANRPDLVYSNSKISIEASDDSNNYLDVPIGSVDVGDQLSLSLGEIKITSGIASGFAFCLVDAAGTYIANALLLQGKLSGTFAVRTATNDARLRLFAGRAGQTAGVGVEYNAVILVRGNIPAGDLSLLGVLNESKKSIAALKSVSEWEIEGAILTAHTVDGTTYITTSDASSSLAPTEAWVNSANRTVRLCVENQGVSSFVSVPVAIVSSSDSTLTFYGSTYAYGTHIDVSINRDGDAWTTNAEVADFATRLNILADEKSFSDLVNTQNVDRLKWIIVQLVDPESDAEFDLSVISKNWSNLDATDFESVPLPMEYRVVFGAFQQSLLFGNLQVVVKSNNSGISIEVGESIIPEGYVDSNMIMNGAITSGKIADGAITTWKIASKAVASHHINDKAIESRHLSDELSDKFTVSPSGSPLHDLFVAAGAVWNDAAKNWTVGLVEGISTDKMAAIYADTNGRLRGNNWDSALYRAGSYTNFPPRTLPISLMVGNIDATSAFYASSLEIVQLTTQNKEPLNKVKFSSINMIFTNCSKLKEVIGVMDVSSCSSVTNAFQACILLQRVNISGLSVNLSLSSTSQLSLDSLQYLVDNAKNTSAITVTVHADVYAKLTDPANTDWYAINEAALAKQISFATA